MNLYSEANKYFEEILKEENAKLNESLKKKKKLKESATARKQLRESTGKAFNLATLQEGDLLYNEQEQIIAPVSKKPGSEPAALVQKVDKESLVPVKQLSTSDWKVVTKNDFPKGSLLWYFCLDDDEREHAKVDDTDDYERAFADALDLLQGRHPDADLVYDSAVQGGWGEIYLRDENTDSEISWDVDEEEEEFYDYLVGVYSYDVLVDGLATWLDSKYEEMIETADEDSDFDESFKYNKSGESKLRETTIEDPYYLALDTANPYYKVLLGVLKNNKKIANSVWEEYIKDYLPDEGTDSPEEFKQNLLDSFFYDIIEEMIEEGDDNLARKVIDILGWKKHFSGYQWGLYDDTIPSVWYSVYELDENGNELDEVDSFDTPEKAIAFAKKQSFPTHVVFVPEVDPDDDPEYRRYLRDHYDYEPFEIVWESNVL